MYSHKRCPQTLTQSFTRQFQSKLKAFANGNVNESFDFRCGKWRKCWVQAFSPFTQCFQKACHLGCPNSSLCGKGLYYLR